MAETLNLPSHQHFGFIFYQHIFWHQAETRDRHSILWSSCSWVPWLRLWSHLSVLGFPNVFCPGRTQSSPHPIRILYISDIEIQFTIFIAFQNVINSTHWKNFTISSIFWQQIYSNSLPIKGKDLYIRLFDCPVNQKFRNVIQIDKFIHKRLGSAY